MTDTTRRAILTALDMYAGENVWEDVIYPHPDYSEVNTNVVEHGEGNYVATLDGSVYRYAPEVGEWREAGSIADYA